MYYDNQNPFERDSYRDLMCKDARRAFSRVHFGIFAYVALPSLIAIIADVLLFLIAGDKYTAISENIYYQWMMGVLPMYVIGLPILYVIVRSMPTVKLEKSRLKVGEFLILFTIAQAVMSVGNYIGNSLNEFFAVIKGDEITNSTAELIDNSPIWLTLIIGVIVGPIIEEFIFRKLLIDRLAKYGAGITVFVSGFSFGLFHGNFYQFFYTAMLGILLAYITVKTGNWIYSAVMHIIINFFGSIAIMPIIEMAEAFIAEVESMAAGGPVNAGIFIKCALASLSYAVFEYSLLIAGLVLLFLAFKNKWYKIKDTAEVNIPREDVFSVILLNTGTIVFIVLSLLLFAASVILY